MLLILIAASLLAHSFIMKQSSLVLSRIEFYLILGVLVAMFAGVFVSMLRPFISKVVWRLPPESDRGNTSGAESTVIAELQRTLNQCEAKLAFQQKSIRALLSISESNGNPLPLHLVYQRALHAVEEVTGFNTIAIRLYDEKRQCLKLTAQQGMSPAMLEELDCIPPKDRFEGEAMRSLWPVPIKDLAAEDPNRVGASPSTSGFRSVVCVPLLADQVAIGTMELGSRITYQWNDDELRWLALVGRTIGMIINQVRVMERLKGVVILEERNRLSQEIHDGLAQLLGSLRLWAEEARLSAEECAYGQVENAVKKIEKAARDASALVREEMLALRNTMLPGEDLLPVFTEYLDRFQRQWGIKVRLEMYRAPIENDHSFLSSEAESQLLRIVQEGLTNIRRHARAQSVLLRVDDNERDCQVFIQDDGIGFDASGVTTERLGLRIMKERAASVGGHVHVHSSAGEGTVVKIVLPKQPLELERLSASARTG